MKGRLMQRVLSRLADGRFGRLQSSDRRGLYTVVGALAIGLLLPLLVSGQGDKTPEVKKPPGGGVERTAKGDSPAPAIKARVFNRSLAGADEGPVFFDVEGDYSFTPPADLVPAENRGKSIENWVFRDPLKAWIRRQGIDFAFQTDGRSHVAVVGFDVRTGTPDSSDGQRFVRRFQTLDPW